MDYLFVFSPSTGKYGPEVTPYLDFFHAVVVEGLILHITFIYGAQQTSFLFGQVKLFEGPGGFKKIVSTPFYHNLHSTPVRLTSYCHNNMRHIHWQKFCQNLLLDLLPY